MAQAARCPSCGAPVEFKSAASVLAVCAYCQSTLLRSGESLENLGRMAEPLADRSPLQLGTEGRWRGRRFALVGRIQLRWEQGLWNEWYLLFDDGQSGWLTDAGGEYVITEPKALGSSPPPFARLEVGSELRLNGRAFTVSNVLTAECVAGQGELPFKVGAGYPAPVADLRDEKGRFATLDYSEVEKEGDAPLLFIGERIEFKALDLSNLREKLPLPEIAFKARAFDCPACGAALKIEHEGIKTIGCASCGALLDPGDARVKVLQEAQQRKKVEPLLPLGSKGKLRGEAVEVLGYLRRRMNADGVDYFWSEYLLLGPDNRQLWLVESDGHWNIARVLPVSIRTNARVVSHEGRGYNHFQTYKAQVDYVIGEFPWRVRYDEVAHCDDYVAPPYLLSRERTPSEVTWSLGEYVQPDEISAAFALKPELRRPSGVYANQPNPYEERHRRVCRHFRLFAILALAVHFLLLIFGPGGKVVSEPLTFNPDDDEPKLTAEFVLDGRANRLEVSHDTSADNNWVGVTATLVNQDTGENWQAAREIGYYSGVDGGESWSEGSRGSEVVFADLPPGRYLLAVESEMDPGAPPIQDRLTIARAGPRWSSLVLLLVFLVVFPVFTRFRKGAFEIRRWAESDHPIVTSDSDDD